MSVQPLISVIMIFLDAEAFIEEAIGSVAAQTYGHWELLLIDDGSGDASTAIARRHAERDPERVRYFEHPGHANRGTGASRNLGLRAARGELIAFLDADDVWHPAKLEEQSKILVAHPAAAMVYGRSEYWRSWHPRRRGGDRVRPHGCAADVLVRPPLLARHLLTGRIAVPCVCGLLVRREALRGVGGFEDSFRGLYEDQVFYLKICLRHPVFVSNGCWDRYRQHPDSTCAVAQRNRQHRPARVFFLDWLAGYLEDEGLGNATLWRTLRREQWAVRHPILGQMCRLPQLWQLLPWAEKTLSVDKGRA